MSTAQQIQPLPSPEPSIFATLAAELGFVPGAPVHDPVPAYDLDEVDELSEPVPVPVPVLAVVPDAAPVDEPAQDWADTDVEQDWSAGQGWTEDEWSDQEWADEDLEPVAEPVAETTPDVDHVDHVDDADTPVAPSPGVPTRRVPSMPPISRT